jgi:hypothetical protein
MQALKPLCAWGTKHMKRIGAKKAQQYAAAGRNVR